MLGTKSHGWWHIAEYPIEEVIRNQHPRFIVIDGVPYRVKMKVGRNRIFRAARCHCACCGAEATRAMLDTDRIGSGVASFNIYGVRCGRVVMMTRDHIFPQCLGGTNDRSNMQMLCNHCNHVKDNKTIDLGRLRELVS
jgi:hypothetical protein